MSSSFDDMNDSFRVLSLPPTATEAEIKKAYRKLSLRYHPDKAGKDVDPVKAAARFHEINLAYETLMDPAARARAVQRNAEDAAKRERKSSTKGSDARWQTNSNVAKRKLCTSAKTPYDKPESVWPRLQNCKPSRAD